jgi:hypothetical protein
MEKNNIFSINNIKQLICPSIKYIAPYCGMHSLEISKVILIYIIVCVSEFGSAGVWLFSSSSSTLDWWAPPGQMPPRHFPTAETFEFEI